MQFNDTHLTFLREKIKDIRTALFKAEINCELSLPNNVVETIHTDEEGNIYFFTSCNNNYAAQIDIPFYAYLDYHKKGTDTRLCLSGKAVIVKDDTGCSASKNQDSGISAKTIVLVKMKIMQAEYYGESIQQNNTWSQKLKSSFNHLFFPSSDQRYTFG